jgi:two-component system nitrogen regulation sensor histidine kinase NtrY
MGFKSFRINVVLRIALIGALVLVAVWGVVNTGWQLTPIVCAVLALVLLVDLIGYVESVNRELAGFLSFVAHQDFSASIPIGRKGPIFRDLESAYSVLMAEFRKLNQEKAANYQYLESLVEHVSIALLCLDDEGGVKLMNEQAKRLFKLPHLHSVKTLQRLDPKLPQLISELRDGDRSMINLTVDGEPLQLALYATEFQLLGHRYKIISVQNIRDELEQHEVDFSQKLIRVMTHEIMNSVTPIISLSKVVEDSLLDGGDGARLPDLSSDEHRDLLRSVASIQSRGNGLLRFVQAYGTLTNLPQPKIVDVGIPALLEQTGTLMAALLKSENVVLETQIDEEGLSVKADPEQLQQVLINLVKNAVEAVSGEPDARVRLRASRNGQGQVLVQVIDSGPGIDESQLDHIFVPFFTTKRHGTGVGLSVSRQIMFLNKGLISVKTKPGRGSEFSLTFR